MVFGPPNGGKNFPSFFVLPAKTKVSNILAQICLTKYCKFVKFDDGRFALIEFKLGQSEVDEGASHLCEIERLIRESNQSNSQNPLRLPDLKIVVTGTQYGYKRDDGVFVIPIGCLKD